MSADADDTTGETAGGAAGIGGLIEPVRLQLVAMADEVLGRLPADEVPAPLRPVAKFTPSKRRRLGATVIAAALDADDDFRERVAEAATTAAPQLADAISTGTPTPAAGPIDVAALAYLVRPDGWQALVDTAGRQWLDERGAGDETAGELERLRSEVATLRSASRGESGRVRDAVRAAVDEATASADHELVTLRRTVRDRTRDLRAAERDRDAALAAAAAAEEEVAAQADVHRTELDRWRERLAEAGRAAEASRRGSRTERDIDDARLWLLVDTLVQAAAGVRRELSLAAPDVRPADGVEAADVPGAGRGVADPATLDALLALPHLHLVVDGYNVTKTGYPNLALADQRGRLVGSLAALAARSGAEVTVVWDGAARPAVQPPAPRGVRVLFSAADEIADDLIRRLVAAEPPGRPVLVITSDKQIVRDTARAGVWSAPSAVLLARLG